LSFDPRAWKKPDTKDYYVGVDLGQKRDYTVAAVIEKKDRHYKLVHMKQFPLGTEYTNVIEYLKLVAEKFANVRSFYIDQTGVGEFFVENAIKHGLKSVKGVILTMPQKQDVMTCLKQVMEEQRLHVPRDAELLSEMGDQIAELTSTGKTKFYHRSGTHDDRLWALALGVYAARYDIEPYHPVVIFGRNPNYGPSFDWRRFRRGAANHTPRPGDPAGLVVHGQLWCWSCGRPVLTRPHVCETPQNLEAR
jgi:phage FluMu gp28-like protein